MRRQLSATVLAVLLTGAACSAGGGGGAAPTTTGGGGDGSTTAPKTTEPTRTTVTRPSLTTTTVAPKKGPGSRAEPLPVGESANVGDWDVTITKILPDANAIVTAKDEYSQPPTKGRYMIVTADIAYAGSDEGTPRFDLDFVLSGSDAVQYASSSCYARVGERGDSTLEPGGKVSVTLCIDTTPEAVKGASLFVEDRTKYGQDRVRAYWEMP